ncbi:Bystin [Entamoeba marina]
MKGLRKHTSKAMDEPANKARVALGQEMEDVGKVKQSRRQKKKLIKMKNKIISSAMQQLKEDKMEVEYDINQLDDNAMEIEYENEMEEEVESDSEDNADNLEKEYDVAIDEESLQLLEAFKNDVEVADVNSMITSQLNLIKKEESKTTTTTTKPVEKKQIPTKVVKMFNELGVFLSHYHVGRMPRVFKLLPSFEEWAELLQLTNPATWTPHSLFAATKLFIHSTSSIAEKFMNTFLLPIIRNSMHKTKKLHFQEYLAVKRCIYQPAAFFKGIIFPLCQTNDVTFKEATIIASILQKVSIPAKHSAVALYKLSTIPYNSTQGLFMKTLLDKKCCCELFPWFHGQKQNLPLLWHQSLLVLVQRYVKDFKPQQITQLQKLCQVHKHHAITSVVIIQLQKSHN